MSARDDLTALIERLEQIEAERYHPEHAAEAILAAGYRPPSRTISGTPAEVRAELDALPIGTVLRYTEPNRDWRDVPHEVVVKGAQGALHEWRSSIWRNPRDTYSIARDEVPMVVLYEPEVVR